MWFLGKVRGNKRGCLFNFLQLTYNLSSTFYHDFIGGRLVTISINFELANG